MATLTLLTLSAIWILFFWLWRDYRCDLCRDRLFAIREELFDMAARQEIEFSSPSYEILRSTINGTIQFTHRLTLLEFLGFAIGSRGKAGERMAAGYRENWEKACASLPQDIRQKLDSIRGRVHFQVFEQVIMTSAILMFSLISLFFVFALRAISRRVHRGFKRVLNETAVGVLADSFDSAVLAYAS